MTRALLLLALFVFAQCAMALSVIINFNYPAVCTYSTGGIYASATGGVPPYTYLWNTGATEYLINDIPAGMYSVTVTDDVGTQASANYTMATYPLQATVGGFQGCPDGLVGPPFRMLGQASIWNVGIPPLTMQDPNYQVDVLNGIQEWEHAIYLSNWNGWPAPGTVLQLPFTDNNGCPGTMEVTVPQPFAYPVPQVLTVDGVCSGGYNGGALVHVPAAQNPWPNYIELIHDGSSYGLLQDQYNAGQMFGETPLTIQRNDLLSGQYAMVVWTRYPYPYDWLEQNFFPFGNYCGDTTWFTVPDLGFTCGTLIGTAYMDDNFNCTAQYNEARVPATVMEIQPGGYFTMTNATGDYHQNLPYGSYTVQQQSVLVAEHCAGAPQAFDLPGGLVTATRNFPDTTLIPRDVELDLASSPARPGSQMSYSIGVDHLTAGVTGAMTVSLVFDPVLSYVSGSPAPASVVGNTITWNLAQLTSFGYRYVGGQFQIPANIGLVGTDLISTATVGIAQPETNLANNSNSDTRTITASLDPNAKEVSTSSGWSNEFYYIDQDNWLDYTIQFQNTGTDTAFFVVITDSLPATLDPSTFNMGTRSHAGSVEMGGHGVLRFIFPNILLPDSTTNESRSHGFVSFRIKPYLPIVPGTLISNTANIFFDLNPPVITEPSVLTAEFSTAVHEQFGGSLIGLFPNPGFDQITLQVDGNFSVRIMDMAGRVVLRSTGHSDRATLSTSRLVAGVYLVGITTIDGRTFTRPWTKL
ncbi:MAG: T9SS type A sorting domain-containing protein [Flavobacteriales bacterium]|nr:T9SS type A sorting domain-containing protein [Flavobacteriales bacterium]